MNYIIDGRTMKAADHYTIETIGIPSLVLMERAALQVVETVKKEKIDITRSLIVCGSGNNGGDGIAVGRLLLEKGAKVTVVLAGNPDHCTEIPLCPSAIRSAYPTARTPYSAGNPARHSGNPPG